jgi:hypothetical protein
VTLSIGSRGCARRGFRNEPNTSPRCHSGRRRGRLHLRRCQEAAEAFSHIPSISGTLPLYTTATLALISDIAGAARDKDKVMAALPGSTIASLTSWLPYADPSLLEQLQDGLRKAGVPE